MKIRLVRLTSLALLVLLCVGGHALALDDPNRITLPTAASIVGVAPFFSDVRVFNTSYDSTISIEATYRCFIGPCATPDRGLQIVVGPRETKSYNDIVGVAFGDDDVRATIRDVYARTGYLLDPHSAIAYLGVRRSALA